MTETKVGFVTADGDTYCVECCAGASGLPDAVPVFAGRSECYSCDTCGDHLPHTGLDECAGYWFDEDSSPWRNR